jgi:hypothetical protein
VQFEREGRGGGENEKKKETGKLSHFQEEPLDFVNAKLDVACNSKGREGRA